MFCLLLLALTIYGTKAQVITASHLLKSWPNAKGHIVIPDTVTEIGTYAFYGNDSILSVVIPPSVHIINYGAFTNCHSLDSVSISDDTYSIGQSVFENCTSLRSIKLPDSLYTLFPRTFSECTKLQRIETGKYISYIPSNVFVNCNSLKEVVLGNAVNSIWDYAFSSCPSLSSLIMGKRSSGNKMAAIRIGEYAFENCPIQKVELNKNMSCTESSTSCFINTTTLKILTIGDSVTTLPDQAFSGCSSIGSLKLPKSIIKIGKNAFFGCSGLSAFQLDSANTSFSCQDGILFNKKRNKLMIYPAGKQGNYAIPASVDTVSDYAFSGAKGLTNLIVPSTINCISTYAFSKCTALKTVRFMNEDGTSLTPISVDRMAFDSCSNIEYLHIDRYFGTNQKVSPFRELAKLDSVFIGNKATFIYDNFFTNCTALKKVVIGDDSCRPGDSITIGTNAFWGCSSLKYLYLNESIGSYSSGFTFVDSIRLGPSVRSIGSGAFSNCDRLKFIQIPSNVIQLGSGAFNGCDSLVQISLTDSITKIGNNCFGGCLSLKSITIPVNIKTIGYQMFEGCKSLETVLMSDQITEIDNIAFIDCSSLKNFKWPKSLKRVGYMAFSGCRSLPTIELNNSVTILEEYAFSGCSRVTDLTLSSGLTTILANTFSDCTSLKKLVLPNSITYVYANSFTNCSRLKSIIIGENTGTVLKTTIDFGAYPFPGCDSVTYIEINRNIRDNTSSAPFISFKELTDAKISESVTSLPSSVFMDCSKLKNLEMLGSIQTIGHSAFALCKSLENITLPKTLTSLSHYVFIQCTNFKHVWSYNPTPPATGTDCFIGVPVSTCVLHVPAGSKSLYKSTDQWKAFTNIQEFDIVGLDMENKMEMNIFTDRNVLIITSENDKSIPFGIYTMDGRTVWRGTLNKKVQIDHLNSGIYIVRGIGFQRKIRIL